jgi:quinoprotein relay system zinc metallohydrolase 2
MCSNGDRRLRDRCVLLCRRWGILLAGAGIAWSSAIAGPPPEMPGLSLENPVPGVYVHYGQQAEMTPGNLGDVANFGFVVGARCVAVIDTGGTFAVGRALRQAIRRVSAVPVCYVINTHVHPDHVFGNAAFVEDRPEFIGHARLSEAMRVRGPSYLHALRRDLGAAAAGSEIVLPTRAVAGSADLDLGGRILRLRAWPTAHTDNDLTVFDAASRTLWLGDLLFVGHVPVVDGSLRGFLRVIEEVKRIPADNAIPGHGRAFAWPQAIVPEERYLERLLADVRASIRAGRTLAETLATVEGTPDEWLLFDQFHRRNITAAYAELEWDE